VVAVVAEPVVAVVAEPVVAVVAEPAVALAGELAAPVPMLHLFMWVEWHHHRLRRTE